MTEPRIPTQPVPPHIDRALRAMDAVLDGDLDLDTRLTINCAYATLFDARPLYPPRLDIAQPMPLAEGIALALTELTAAIETAASLEEAVRAGLTARELRTIGTRP